MREPFTIEHGVSGGKTFLRGAGMLVLLIVVVIVAFSSTSCVRTGHVGVVSIFGRVTGRTLSEGIHLVNPGGDGHRAQYQDTGGQGACVGAVEGGTDHGARGLDPVSPGSEACGRGVSADRAELRGGAAAADVPIRDSRHHLRATAPSSLYSDARETIARQILDDVARQVAPRGVIVENVLLRDLQLPDTLKHAIEAKQQAQQEAQRMEFVLQREKQEAERKRVEAAGIKDFQDIVTQGISEKLLEWKGIEATMELVKSQNSKVIVVGNSRNGLPLIYSGEK